MTTQPPPPFSAQPPIQTAQPGGSFQQPPPTGPSGVWYVIGVLLLLAGIGGAIALVVNAGVGKILAMATQSNPLDVPGVTTVEMTEPGPKTIYLNTRDMDHYPDELGVMVTVDGAELSTSTPTMTETITIQNQTYSGIRKLQVAQPCTLSVETTLAEDVADKTIDARIGPSIEFQSIARMGAMIVLAILVGLLGLTLGLLTLILTGVKRSKAARLTRSAPPIR